MLDPLAHTVAAGELPATLRTEDVKFSSDGTMLVAAATDGSILLFKLDLLARPIEITNYTQFKSDSLASPHGVDFLDDRTIVVANRLGGLTFYRVPAIDRWTADMEFDLLQRWESAHFGAAGQMRLLRTRSVMCGPGSIRVFGNRLFVCCNNTSTVSVHRFTVENRAVAVHSDEVLAQEGLEIPDGVAVSRDGRWAAISDHDHHRVVVHDLDTGDQSCVLRDAGLNFPHGLCFDFEGGIKGLDIDPSGRVLATTCQNQVLLFFDIAPLLS
jgi:WD40 repeat protein